MNSRISELTERVGATYIPRYDIWQMDTPSLKELVRQVVLECADISRKGATPEFQLEGDYARGSEHAAWRIENHFGVENE